jgi:hypothetical protein
VNCALVPSGITVVIDVIAIETRAGPPTVSDVELEMESEVAEMVEVPCPELVANP